MDSLHRGELNQDRDMMSSKHKDGDDQVFSGDSEESEWLLDGLAIRPPLEEFRRLFEMKKRAFEGKVDAESRHKYEMARRLGEKFIADREYGTGIEPGGDPC
ncbi:MAG: hypothetical protein CMJ95_07025 [Planctomycetes bacterium]|nr:hypothetical protein [Planctomycetota bacterium]